ncbi:hypothetical protein JXA59_02775 [Patescibacteria group bacterium]|nr:hypothetical protein [Patescibacteria group bacterium]
METAKLVDHQIRVEVTQAEGAIVIKFPEGPCIIWPVKDSSVATGVMYLTLSPQPTLPDKAELARQVLKEILQINQ